MKYLLTNTYMWFGFIGVVLGIAWTITKDDYYILIASLFIAVMGFGCAKILFREAKKIKNNGNSGNLF